jgi:reverse gyrase
MKTFKYYKVEKINQIPQIDEVEVFDYDEIDNNKIVGVFTGNHLLFEDEVEATEQTFDEIKDAVENCHLNKQLGKDIVNNIRLVYSVDDEIALMKKADDNSDKIAMDVFIASIKDTIDAKKIEYGLKQ